MDLETYCNAFCYMGPAASAILHMDASAALGALIVEKATGPVLEGRFAAILARALRASSPGTVWATGAAAGAAFGRAYTKFEHDQCDCGGFTI